MDLSRINPDRLQEYHREQRAKQEHTAQTLDRLKGMVESVPVAKESEGVRSFKKGVLQLIEEVSDE